MATTPQPDPLLTWAASVDWRAILTMPAPCDYPAGTVLARQGDAPRYVYFIDSGLLKITRRDEHNAENLVKLVAKPGHVLGAACAILDTHILSYVTLTDASLSRLSAARFVRMLKSDTSLSWQLHRAQCADLLSLVTELTHQRDLSVRRRVEELLSQLIAAQGHVRSDKNIKLKLPLKYVEIARYLSVTPEHLSRVIKRMTVEGLIQRQARTLIVPDASLLNGGSINS